MASITFSGVYRVFRISVRRGPRGAVGVEGVGWGVSYRISEGQGLISLVGRDRQGMECSGGWGVEPCPEENVFVPEMITFDAAFNRQKTRTVTRSLGTRILRFNREKKPTKTVQKLSKNSRSEQRGVASRTPSSPQIRC